MKRAKGGFVRALAVTLLVFAALFIGTLMLLDYIGDSSDDAQTELVRKAVHNAVVTCYAVEGAYPQSVEYLVENYGLAYDRDRFLITYDAFASNIFPEIRVNVKGAADF